MTRQNPETGLQDAMLHYLRLRGHFVWRQNTQGVPIHRDGKVVGFRPASIKGVADILGVQRGTGRFIAVEVKMPGGKATDAQFLFLQSVREKGGLAIVANTLEDLQAAGL